MPDTLIGPHDSWLCLRAKGTEKYFRRKIYIHHPFIFNAKPGCLDNWMAPGIPGVLQFVDSRGS